MAANSEPRTGIVIIGKDLGARLVECLRAVAGHGCPVVYVDSASRDRSAETAAEMGVPVVALKEDRPLSASRGRNEGAAWMQSQHPTLQHLQFVDGDCEVDPGWIAVAESTLAADPRLAIVCGRVREKHAARSIAATLLDVDWGGPVGEIHACGGIFMARRTAFEQVGGFLPTLATGEEAEFCGRLRAKGWHILRIDRPMCKHDAEIHSLGGWWRRAVRVGRTYAASATLRGESREPAARGRILRTLLWSTALPVFGLGEAFASIWHRPMLWITLGVLTLYSTQVLRMAVRQWRRGHSLRSALLHGVFTLAAKWAHTQGFVQHWARR